MPAPNTLKKKKQVDHSLPVPIEFQHEGNYLEFLGVPACHPAVFSSDYSFAFNLQKHLHDVEAGTYEPVLVFDLPYEVMGSADPEPWEAYGGSPRGFLPGSALDPTRCMYLIADGVQKALAAHLLGRDLRANLVQADQGLEILNARNSQMDSMKELDLSYLRGQLLECLNAMSVTPISTFVRTQIINANVSPDAIRQCSRLYRLWNEMGLTPQEAGISGWCIIAAITDISKALKAHPVLSKAEAWPGVAEEALGIYILREIFLGISDEARPLYLATGTPLGPQLIHEITKEALLYLRLHSVVSKTLPSTLDLRAATSRITHHKVTEPIAEIFLPRLFSGALSLNAARLISQENARVQAAMHERIPEEATSPMTSREIRPIILQIRNAISRGRLRPKMLPA